MMKLSEYERWMRQAERTLRSALRDLDGSDYEWASFKAQQAAELAVKALLRGVGANWALDNALAQRTEGRGV